MISVKGGMSNQPIARAYKARILVTKADVSNAATFASACLSWTECARVGWYRALAREPQLGQNRPMHLPRVNRLSFPAEAVLPIPGDFVDASVWVSKVNASRAFSVSGLVTYRGKVVCHSECVRVLISFTEPQKQKLAEFVFEPLTGTPSFENIDIMKSSANGAKFLHETSIHASMNDIDGLKHVNMALYPIFIANTYPFPMHRRLKRFDVEYNAEISRIENYSTKVFQEANEAGFLFITTNSKGKVMNQTRFEFYPEGEMVLTPNSVKPSFKSVMYMTRYESTAVVSRFAYGILEMLDLALDVMPQKPTSLQELSLEGASIDIKFASRPIMSVITRLAIRPQTSSNLFQFDLFDVEGQLPVCNVTIDRTSTTGKQLQTKGQSLMVKGRYEIRYKPEFMYFTANRFNVASVMGMIHDARDEVEQATSQQQGKKQELDNYTSRVVGAVGDSWFDQFTIQFYDSEAFIQWITSNQQTAPSSTTTASSTKLYIEVKRDEENKLTRFDFITSVDVTKIIASIVCYDIRDADSPLKSFNPFGHTSEKHARTLREVEGILDDPTPIPQLNTSAGASSARL